MKLVLTNIINQLSIINQVIDNKSTLPILNSIRLKCENNTVILTASNLEIELTAISPAEVLEPGNVCISSEKLLKFAKLYDKFKITTEKNNVILASKSKSIINSLPYDIFPDININKENSINLMLDANKLAYCINNISHAIGFNDVRFFLTGISFEIRDNFLNLCASDGHRLSFIKMQLNSSVDDFSCILQGKAAIIIQKIFKNGIINVSVNNNSICCSNDTFVINAKNIDAKYPDLRKIFNINRSNSFIINANELSKAIESVLITANKVIKGITIVLEKNKLKISSHNPDSESSEIEIDINYTNNDLSISINAMYLLDVLNKCDKCTLSIDDNSSSILIQPEDDAIMHIIMSMRI